jgi:hypothetical protein
MNLLGNWGGGGGGAGLWPAAMNVSAMVKDDTVSATEPGGSRAPEPSSHLPGVQSRAEPLAVPGTLSAHFRERGRAGIRSHPYAVAAHALKGPAGVPYRACAGRLGGNEPLPPRVRRLESRGPSDCERVQVNVISRIVFKSDLFPYPPPPSRK